MYNKETPVLYPSLSVKQTAENLSVNPKQGLNKGEVRDRLQTYGENKIAETKRRTPLYIFLTQFKSPIVYLLVVAAGFSFYFKEWLDAIAILVVIFVNTIVGFYMEYQAERSMNALKKMAAVTVKLLRDGQLGEYEVEKIVPGDILYAEAGDLLPADARIFNSQQLQVDESALTGESVPVDKHTEEVPADTVLAEQSNMFFKGTFVTKGNGWGIVTHTGMQTELGKIAGLVQGAKQAATPLEKKLEAFSKKLIKVTIVLVVVIFIAGLLNGQNFMTMISTAIALAVAAIPEGLPIVATLALAKGVLKMARQQVIVKKLSSVETLGGTNYICTDKTGTLTENRIRVARVITTDKTWKEGEEYPSHDAFEVMKNIAVLCNTAEINQDKGEKKELGDPLETGLLKFAITIGEDIDKLRSQFPKTGEIPFSSETKLMATRHAEDMVYAKGAAEELLPHCTHVLQQESIEPINEEQIQYWLAEVEKAAAGGLRVIGGAYKHGNVQELTEGLVFAGLFGMIDPPRKEVFDAIKECRDAGITITMITGDHPATARNIAGQLGMTDDDTAVILGTAMPEYEQLTDEDKTQWQQAAVFARVSPQQKLDLVKVLQERGNIVGMTGDGINDAPALKKADIGIAMGLRGTQVAQEVADMVLKDDSFSSIVAAIKQGRIIFENIRKFVMFLLSCNLSELLVIAVAAIFNTGFRLLPLQILFINLITDVLPALALGITKGSDDIMKKQPRSIQEPIINRKRWWTIIFYSAILALASVGAVLFSHYYGSPTGERENNILFFTLIFSQLLHVFNMGSSNTGFFTSEVMRSRYIWYATLGSFAILVATYFIAPVKLALSIGTMHPADWCIAAGASIASVIIIQLAKTFKLVKQ